MIRYCDLDLARDQTVDLRAGETRRAPSWVLYFLSAFERAGMILTGTNSSHAPSSSHLAKVYPTSTSSLRTDKNKM